MNNLYKSVSREIHSEVNPDIMRGFATRELKGGLQYLFTTITNIIREHKLDHVLELRTITPMSPRAIMDNIVPPFDVSRSDLLYHKLEWTYKGIELSNRILLPCGENNVITFTDVKFLVIPEVTDMVISILGNDMILISIIKKKIKVVPTFYAVVKDGIIDNQTVIFSRDLLKLNAGKIRIPLLLYKLIKDGMLITLGVNGKIIHEQDYDNEYNPDLHVKIMSRKLKGKGSRFGFILDKEQMESEDNKYVTHRLVQIMYMFDMIQGIDEELFELQNDNILDPTVKIVRERNLWKITCSLILSDNKQNADYNRDIVTSHLSKLEYLSEDVSFRILERIGIKVHNYTDLLAICSDKFIEWTIGLDDGVFDDKRLEVNPKVYQPITNRISKILSEMKDGDITPLEFDNWLKNKLRPGAIFDLKTKQDTLFLKEQINANPVWQNLTLNTQNKKNSSNEDLIPDANAVTIGNINVIKKNIPYPTATINPNCKIGDERLILKDPKMDLLATKIAR